jgi:hypothetical protein
VALLKDPFSEEEAEDVMVEVSQCKETIEFAHWELFHLIG